MAPRKGGQGEGVAGGLQQVYTAVSNLALEPDAGQFGQVIEGLRQGVLKAIQGIQQMKAQEAAQMQMQQRQQAINPMMGGPQQPGQQPPRPQMGQPGGPPSQGSPGLSMPNPDELARLLSSQAGG